MASIDWSQAVSGTWTTAADWAGGVVPGPEDTAVIDAVDGKDKYTVTITTPISVGGVILDSSTATLSVDNTLTVGSLSLEAGTLALDNGTLNGTVTASGGTLDSIGTDDTLNNVTWDGLLACSSAPTTTLIINGGLNLRGSGGSGLGTAMLSTKVVLDGVSTLDHAVIDAANGYSIAQVTNVPKLTLGSRLTLGGVTMVLKSGMSLVNNGLMDGAGVEGGKFTNNGTITGYSYIDAASFKNNGTIDVVSNAHLTLSLQGLQAAGSSGVLDISNDGTLILQGNLTKAQLKAVFSQQHISDTGNFTTAIQGTLNNAGNTLDVGTGSMFGSVTVTDGGVVGGTILDEGGTGAIGGELSNLILQSQGGTLDIGSITANDVTVTGASVVTATGTASIVLNGGTLSGVGTVSINGEGNPYGSPLTLNGVDITGAGNSGSVTIVSDNCGAGIGIAGLNIGADQSVAGYNILLTNSTGLSVAAGATLDDATVTFANAPASALFSYANDANGSSVVTLGTSCSTVIASDASVTMSGNFEFDSTLAAEGTFTVAGTLAFGYEGNNTTIDNSGLISVSAGGTLSASGIDVTLANSGTIAASSGVIDIAESIANTGMITAALGGSATTMTIGGAVTGAGTLAISGAGTMALGGTVASGQVVQLGAGSETLALTNAAASAGFSGTLDGFAKGDAVVLSGENISAAQFVGASIVATISTGGSIVLATGTHLSGSISVSENSGNATLTYASSEPSLRDWSAGAATGIESHGVLAPHEVGGVLPRWEGSALELILSHRPWH